MHILWQTREMGPVTGAEVVIDFRERWRRFRSVSLSEDCKPGTRKMRRPDSNGDQLKPLVVMRLRSHCGELNPQSLRFGVPT